jgi:putative membrane protein
MGMARVKQVGAVGWLIGISAFIGLTIWTGPSAVGHSVVTVGWGLSLVVVARVVSVAAAGAGWWLLFPAKTLSRLRTCVLLRFIREAINVLLMQVGGDLIGARLLTLRGVSGPLAAASVIVDVLIQAATQLLFAILGLIALIALQVDDTLVRIATVGLTAATLMLVGFYLAQRRSGQRILRWSLGRVRSTRKWRVLGTTDAVYQNLAMIYSSRFRIFASGLTHMTGWIVGVIEVLVVLSFMGHSIGIAEALVIESLMQAIRGAAFVIPGAFGAQEGGLVLLCGEFGIAPEQAIALSLAKRAADLVLGVPSLFGWQVLEWERLKHKYTLTARSGGSVDSSSHEPPKEA